MKTVPKAPAVALAYGLALWPQAHWFIARTKDQSDDPLGILALATAALLAWSQRHRLRGAPLLGWVTLVLTVVTSFVFPPMLTGALALLAIAFASGLFRSAGLTGLLLLALPLIASFNFYCSWPLRIGISACSTFILNLLGLTVTREGALLIYQNTEVGVDAPCSGVCMIWFTAYLTCTLFTWHRLSWKKFVKLLPLALLLSFGANITRATLLFFPESNLITLPYWSHQAVGVLLHLAVALLISLLVTRTNQKTQCSIKHHSSSSAPASA